MNDPVIELVVAVYVLAAVIAGGFLVAVKTLHKLERTIRMGLDELKTAAQSVADNVSAVGDSITAEITRVEDVIAKLKTSGIDPTTLDPITVQLQTVATNLQAMKSALDAEQPAAPTA